MEKKGVFGVGLLLLVLIVIGGSIYYLYTNRDDMDDVLNGVPVPIEEEEGQERRGAPNDNINLSYDYLGDNVWRYMVTGTLPNPCYEISTQAIVLEGDPEQVLIRATITPPGEDELCPQVIQEVYEEEEVEAEEDAEFTLQVE